MDALPRENWTPYQLQIATHLGTVERDVITGELFVPQFEGQRTNVFIDIDPAGKTAEEFAAEVREQVMSIKETQWGNDPYMNVTRADMEAELDAMKRRGEAPTDEFGNRMRWDETVDYWYNKRFGTGEDAIKTREVDQIMGQLVGGGENAFVRTAEGLDNWRAMQHGELANFAVVVVLHLAVVMVVIAQYLVKHKYK